MSHAPRRRRLRRRGAGFTLVESLISVSLLTLACSALVSVLATSLRTGDETLQMAVAQGLADQLADEVRIVPFPTASSTKDNPSKRSNFNDLDDYAGYTASPPQTREGKLIGIEDGELSADRATAFQPNLVSLAPYQQEVVVERVQPNSAGTWTVTSAPTSFRRVTVRINYLVTPTDRRVRAEVTQIIANVTPAP